MFLAEHAPGSGKTNDLALFAVEATRLVDYGIITRLSDRKLKAAAAIPPFDICRHEGRRSSVMHITTVTDSAWLRRYATAATPLRRLRRGYGRYAATRLR